MNHQPFYHQAELRGDEKVISKAEKAIQKIRTVLKDTVECFNEELLFTATMDVSSLANDALEKIPGLTILKPVDAEAGDPADLL